MAASSATATPKTFLRPRNTQPFPSFRYFCPTLKFPSHKTSFPKYSSRRPLLTTTEVRSRSLFSVRAAAAPPSNSATATTFHGPCYVLGDNIDTDQIIPAEYLTLVPSNPDEYAKLGTFAFCGLPSAAYPVPFVDPGAAATRFPIVIAGANFGCGSSREHAPVAIGAAGAHAVVAESYARIFFRNSVATGEIYPLESEGIGLCRECSTGDIVTVDPAGSRLINHTTGKEYNLKPLGDAGPVIEAGGIFAYARKTGMIASATA